MAVGSTVIRQDDFSAGMFSSETRERIPRNGVYQAQDVLVDDTGGLYRRGGATLLAGTSPPASQILWVWQGTLTGGARTLAATASTLYSVSGGTFTSIGAYTGMAGGASRPAVYGGKMFLPGGNQTYDGTTLGTGTANAGPVTSVAGRLVAATTGNTVSFSKAGDPTTFAATDFWLIPEGSSITGLATLRDAAVVFTDRGTWVISNMALNLTDAAGNVQQRLDLYSPDMVLWGSGAAGVVGYQGGLIVPARDGVWLMSLGVGSEAARPLQIISGPIATLYRSLVTAGHKPGQAAVFRGHYFLPVLNSSNAFVGCFVCRLDTRARPWTTFNANGGALAFTSAQNGQTLIGGMPVVSGASKLATLNYFDGTGADLNGNQPQMNIITRDYLTGSLTENTALKVRVGYRLADPSSTAQVAYGGSADGVFTGGVPRTLGTIPATAGILSTGSLAINDRTRAVRYQFSTSTTATQATLESIETFVRSSGRI